MRVVVERMDRDEFFARLDALGEERVQKALWNLYWRGTAEIRRRIEAELQPGGARPRRTEDPIDPEAMLDEVRRFVELARCGAYLGRDRRVSPRERTRWRFTFQRLLKESERSLRDENLDPGAAVMELLLDLSQELRGYDYFRSEDPIEAARIVVSDEVALLWSQVHDRRGFAEFARSAAPQLVRWESEFGWTRTGFGRVRERETSLTIVLERLLSVPDHWVAFADHYLEALDALADPHSATSRSRRHSSDRGREERTRNLAEWHLTLLDQLFDGDAEDRLDRLAAHLSLGGPDLVYFRAQLARRRGDLHAARRLIAEALDQLPGHRNFLAFAIEIGAPLPSRAEEIARSRVERLM